MSFSSRSSVARNSEDPPHKKKASLLLSNATISSLPDDLVFLCLARVSRLYYPTLSLVSKKFRLLIASPELYEVRSRLRRTESCLYVCLRFSDSYPNPRWFILCQKPSAKKRKKKSSGYVLATIPIPHSPPAYSGSMVSIGSNIYAIGGSTDNKDDDDEAPPSSSVSILDCRTHTWHEAPNMGVKRRFAYVNVFDGKIYVAGGCRLDVSSNWMEVFDTKTETWETICYK